jgi:hypothetical protein
MKVPEAKIREWEEAADRIENDPVHQALEKQGVIIYGLAAHTLRDAARRARAGQDFTE